MAYSIIKDENIPENDVIILSSGYKPPIELKYIKRSFRDINKGWIKKIKTWNTPKSYDRYISHLTNGEDYIAYIDMMQMYQRILITNPKCQSFHFIEEGSASYVECHSLDEITRSFRKMPYRYSSFNDFLVGFKFILRGYSLRLLGMSYWPESYGHFKNIKFYCFSLDAYPGIDITKKIKLELKIESKLVKQLAHNISLTNESIWIEDSFAMSFNMPLKLYNDAISSTIGYLKRKTITTKIYLKLRPRQLQKDSMVYKLLIEANYHVEVINNDVIIEALLANSQNCIVIGNVSSVLFYAPLLGHKSLSLFDNLKEKPKTSFDNFPVFWKNIVRI